MRSIPAQDLQTPHRPARPDEMCTCLVRPAVWVWTITVDGREKDLGWCGCTMEQIAEAARRHPANRRGEFIA